MFRVYVGNLPYRVNGEELARFFEDAGCVVAMANDRKDAIVPQTEDRRSKGFGFVSFADEESFEKAKAMDEQQMDGRVLHIKEALPREERRDNGSSQSTAPMNEAAPVEEVTEEA